MKNKKQKKPSIIYNVNFKKWIAFTIETIVMGGVAAFIAFVFEGSILFGVIIAIFLILCLIAYLIILTINEHRVSVIAIMQQNINDQRFEDAIRYGEAIIPVLSASNQNRICVEKLGGLMLKALKEIESEESRIVLEKETKLKIEIEADLYINVFGWMGHLSNINFNGAKPEIHILKGMCLSREYILKYQSIYLNNIEPMKVSSDTEKEILNLVHKIAPLVKLIMKGYRHLSVIYREDYEHQDDRADNIDEIIRVLLSSNKEQSFGVCECRDIKLCNPNLGGLLCGKDNKERISCIIRNIKTIYLETSDTLEAEYNLETINFQQYTDISINDVETELWAVRFIRSSTSGKQIYNEIVTEQCYAWSRNIVKKLQATLFMHDKYFVSDNEWQMKITEAKSFAYVYYYGDIPSNISLRANFRMIEQQFSINKADEKKSLRFMALLCEIQLMDILQESSIKGAGEFVSSNDVNSKINDAISMLRTTRKCCKGKRADLFVRCSVHLINALIDEYKINYRYSMARDKDLSKRTTRIGEVMNEINAIHKSTLQYEHSEDSLLAKSYKEAKKIVRDCKRENDKQFKFSMCAHPPKHISQAIEAYSKEDIDLLNRLPNKNDGELNRIKIRWYWRERH